MTEPTDKEQYLNIADQCAATATSDLAASILVDGGNGTLRQLLNDAADAIRAGWATQQSTQAQAGAVPLTEEHIKEVMDLVSDWGMQSHLRGEAELDAHNPEATDDEITYAKECAEKERAAWNAIKDKLQAHGIKGGQHGPS